MDPTDMHRLLAEGPAHLRARFSNPGPGPTMAETSDIAVAVAWLTSDDACYVTGAHFPVDLGGDGSLNIDTEVSRIGPDRPTSAYP